MFPPVSRAGEWFLRSGIQSPDGGVARYYYLDLGRNHAVSTEITGYAVSALVYLHSLTPDARYLDQARAGARFLLDAWDAGSQSMPYQIAPAEFSYFFDCGIIVRGLLAAWRATGEEDFLAGARAVGDSMARHFAAPGDRFHPIVTLPEMLPLRSDPQRWSRSPGCYQLKSALGWWDLGEATGEERYRQLYETVLEDALRTADDFLPGHSERRKVVDRLHAFLYFLEGLLPVAAEPRCALALCQGIRKVAGLLRDLAPEFERSDVYAQLLRVRLYAASCEAVPMDREAAQWEADRLAGFSATSADPRVDGGFYFGRTGEAWEAYVNPVSTSFGLQALAQWHGGGPLPRHLLI